MADLVQQIGLDDEDRAEFAGLRTEAGAEVCQVERSALDLHDSSSPSEARWSSSGSSSTSDARVESEAFR